MEPFDLWSHLARLAFNLPAKSTPTVRQRKAVKVHGYLFAHQIGPGNNIAPLTLLRVLVIFRWLDDAQWQEAVKALPRG